jgi:hyperosmotically inducible protein
MKQLPTLLAALALCAGCSQQQVNQTQKTIATEAPRLANDGLIYAQVESKLVGIDADSALHVAVAVDRGDVRLSGRVKARDVAANYLAAARGVAGVKRVRGDLTVDPALPDSRKAAADFALATAVRLNETGQAGVNGVKLGIAANDGVVTLSGDVATDALHATIVDTAQTTSGVKSVVDRLHVSA